MAVAEAKSIFRTFHQNLASIVKNYHGAIDQLHFIAQKQTELQNKLFEESNEKHHHDKTQKSRHIVLSFDGARKESGLGAAAWILWLRDEYGTFEKVFYGGRVLRNASAMIAEREGFISNRS